MPQSESVKVPRWEGQVDIEQARRESGPALEHWALSQAHPGVPLYSGGLLDVWPAWAVDALSICREEAAAVERLVEWERAKKQRR